MALSCLYLVVAAGCAEGTGPGAKRTVGALGGAALGGLLGAQFGSGTGKLAMTAAGTLLGVLVGSEIGRTMDDNDRRLMDEANRRAQTAGIGQSIAWSNPESRHYGTVTPTNDGYSQSGQYCREFQQTVTIQGRTESAYGIACRQPDGTWRILE
jgi:surface antigen